MRNVGKKAKNVDSDFLYFTFHINDQKQITKSAVKKYFSHNLIAFMRVLCCKISSAT